MHNEYDQDEFPRLRPPQTGLPDKSSLKRSLIPAGAPAVLAPDLRVTFPDKARLKQIPTATTGRVVPLRPISARRAWATGAVAAAVAGLVWLASPEASPIAPAAAPAPMASIPAESMAQPMARSLQTPTAIFVSSHTETPLAAEAQEFQPIRMASSPIRPLEARQIAGISEPIFPAGELQWQTAGVAAQDVPAMFASESTPPARERLQSAQEVLTAFVAEQPIGGAIARVKSLRDSFQTARQDIPAQVQDVRLQAQKRTLQWRDAIRKKQEAVRESLDESLKRWESKDWQGLPWHDKQ